MCCGGGPAWKREVVPDHKFDFIEVRDFTENGFAMRAKYLWLYLIVLKDFLVYVSDIFTAITMISTKSWSNQIFQDCKNVEGCISVPFEVTKWLFVGCIIFSFLLLAYESRKARKIIASRDISYAFTNVMASNYYSLRSYDHFCFFDHIGNSTKKKDDLVLFVFFTFKSWKRVILADGPRQVINALTLWSIFLSKSNDRTTNWWDVSRYFPDDQKLSVSALTVTTFFTVLVFVGSMLLLIAATFIYIPLLCYIQGNLKEYVCHKVDKRISQIIKRKNKDRMVKAAELARKEAMGDYSHLKNKKGELIAKPLPQPTLPNLSIDDLDGGPLDNQDTYYKDYKGDDYPHMPARHNLNPSQATFTDDNDSTTHLTRGVDGGPLGKQDIYYNYKGDDYPPMPAYQYYHHNPNPSQATFTDDNDSTIHLTRGARPISQQNPDLQNPHNYRAEDTGGAYEGLGDDFAYEQDYQAPASRAGNQPPIQGYDTHGRYANAQSTGQW